MTISAKISYRLMVIRRTRARVIKVRDVMVQNRFSMRRLAQSISIVTNDCQCRGEEVCSDRDADNDEDVLALQNHSRMEDADGDGCLSLLELGILDREDHEYMSPRYVPMPLAPVPTKEINEESEMVIESQDECKEDDLLFNKNEGIEEVESEEMMMKGQSSLCDRCKLQVELVRILDDQILDMTECIWKMNKYIIESAQQIIVLEETKKRKKRSHEDQDGERDMASSDGDGKEEVDLIDTAEEEIVEGDVRDSVEDMVEDVAKDGIENVLDGVVDRAAEEIGNTNEDIVRDVMGEEVNHVIEDALGGAVNDVMDHVTQSMGDVDGLEYTARYDRNQEEKVKMDDVIDDELEDEEKEGMWDAVDDAVGDAVCDALKDFVKNAVDVLDYDAENKLEITVETVLKGAVETEIGALEEDLMGTSAGAAVHDGVEDAVDDEAEDGMDNGRDNQTVDSSMDKLRGSEEVTMGHTVEDMVESSVQIETENDVENVEESMDQGIRFEEHREGNSHRWLAFERARRQGRRTVRVARYCMRWVAWKASWKVTMYAVPRR